MRRPCRISGPPESPSGLSHAPRAPWAQSLGRAPGEGKGGGEGGRSQVLGKPASCCSSSRARQLKIPLHHCFAGDSVGLGACGLLGCKLQPWSVGLVLGRTFPRPYILMIFTRCFAPKRVPSISRLIIQGSLLSFRPAVHTYPPR